MKMRIFFLSIFLFFTSLFFNAYAETTYSQWKNVYLCPSCKHISKMFFINNTIYALTGNEGLYKSADDGETWTSLKRGLPEGDIKMVDLVGDQEGHLILAINESIPYMWSNGNGFQVVEIMMDSPAFYEWYASLQSWEKIPAKGIPLNVKMTNLVQYPKGVLYASFDDESTPFVSNFGQDVVYQSIDNGRHWTSLQLKETAIRNTHSSDMNNITVTHTKMIIDNNKNLYVKGTLQYNNELHDFVYFLQQGETQWRDTTYSASDIFIAGNNLLGLMNDEGDIFIKEMQIQDNGLLKENKSWTFTAPEQNTHPIIAIEKNNMVMLIRSNNYSALYQLNDVTNPALKWSLVKNGDANIPDITSLALHHNHLYAVGSRLVQDIQYQSMDVFQQD